MYVFATWKDYAITAQITSPVAWTEVTEYADGAVSAGNGSGSMKVGCWYRDWQSGDTAPTLDFSSSPTVAGVVMIVMQKAADDTWGTPGYATAAISAVTTWTAAASLPGDGLGITAGDLLMALVGFRNDSALMTRDATAALDALGIGDWYANQQGTGDFVSIAYGNGYWVAVGSLGRLYYKSGSPVGAWTSNAQGTNNLSAVAYDNGYWVVVGQSGVLYYKASTPDGAWTSNTQGTTQLSAVAYGNGYWVAAGANGVLYYKSSTPDGAWTSNTQGTSSFLTVAYGNGYWVAAGNFSVLYYKASTPDGAWTSNSPSVVIRAALYAGGRWLLVGDSGVLRYRASDPTGAWTSNNQGSNLLRTIVYGDVGGVGLYVIAGETSGTLYYTTDPTGSWTSTPKGSAIWYDAAFDGSYFVVCGTAGDLRMTLDPRGAWTSNYVEAPATHLTTTTGFDCSGDLGYRIVSAGIASGGPVARGTTSTSETGAALFIRQRVSAAGGGGDPMPYVGGGYYG
jgi:hypothetical protein